MTRYILRRVLQMIPTLFGVLLITFVLFNIAGGDPAANALGKSSNARSLEEYDTQRGLNKPLFPLMGGWGKTRAYPQADFNINAGAWSKVEGVIYTNEPGRGFLGWGGGGFIRLTNARVPMALSLQTNEVYRWTFDYRTEAGAIMSLQGAGAVPVNIPLRGTDGAWKRGVITLDRTTEATADTPFSLSGMSGALDIRDMKLQRKASNAFDSQFLTTIWRTVRVDFGTSIQTQQKVVSMLRDGILPSLSLTVPMFLIGLTLQIAIALVCAFHRNRWVDRLIVVSSVAVMSIPYMVWIIIGQYGLGYHFRIFPIWGYESPGYLVLPCLIGISSGLGSGIRFYRAIMLDEVNRDYVRTAVAKGVGRSGVLFRHVLKNAMIPILTSVVVAIPFLYTGSLLLESFFGIPGLGNMAINGLYSSDYDVIRSIVFIGAVLYMVSSLVTDILYTVVDPRVRVQ